MFRINRLLTSRKIGLAYMSAPHPCQMSTNTNKFRGILTFANDGFRQEKDSLGFINVPTNAYYGAQTQRSLQNFQIATGKDLMPITLLHALALLKQVAAVINLEGGKLTTDKAKAIISAAEEVQSGSLDRHFPLVIWQTGSGTQTNMNVNEVIANRANEILGGQRGDKTLVHPNDDVNLSQSSNDIFPTAMNVSIVIEVVQKLIPSLQYLLDKLHDKSREFRTLVKIGRTHLQDAVPMTVGQELSGYCDQLRQCLESIKRQLPFVCELAVGGTAIGTGLNAAANFDSRFCEVLTELVSQNLPNRSKDGCSDTQPIVFKPARNKFAALAGHDSLLLMSGCLNTTATALHRLANDFRLLASGPRCGLGEFILPSNEPGSSIMPGKINPTQCEALSMVCVQVMGNHVTTSIAGSQGHLELNVYKPLLIANMLHSISLLSDASRCFTDHAIIGLRMNHARIGEHVSNSLMLVTALTPVLGYDKSAEVALFAHDQGLSLRQAVLEKGYMTEQQFDECIEPLKMAFPFGDPDDA
ncbi:hypothetical protein AAHC03_01411 [Spirometra sp. Aus1]